MAVGDASILLVHLERELPGSALMEALLSCGESEHSRLLDVIIVFRRSEHLGELREIALSELALAGITLDAPGLIGVDDAARLAAHLDIGAYAAIVLVEHSTAVAATAVFTCHPERLIAVRPVPASVTNSVLDAAREVSAQRRHRAGRRCTATSPATRHASSG